MLNAANATWNRGQAGCKWSRNKRPGQLRMFSFESESEWLVYIFVSHLLAASSDRDEIHEQRISQILFQDGSFRSFRSTGAEAPEETGRSDERNTTAGFPFFAAEIQGLVSWNLADASHSVCFLLWRIWTGCRWQPPVKDRIRCLQWRERERERGARSWTPWPLSRMFCGFLRMGRMLLDLLDLRRISLFVLSKIWRTWSIIFNGRFLFGIIFNHSSSCTFYRTW